MKMSKSQTGLCSKQCGKCSVENNSKKNINIAPCSLKRNKGDSVHSSFDRERGQHVEHTHERLRPLGLREGGHSAIKNNNLSLINAPHDRLDVMCTLTQLEDYFHRKNSRVGPLDESMIEEERRMEKMLMLLMDII